MHYVEVLMGYGHPLFEWVAKEAEVLEPPEYMSYDIMKVTHSMKVIEIVIPCAQKAGI